MQELKGYQKKFLRGLAHNLSPVVIIGQGGLTEQVIRAIDEALQAHELIKIKFNDFKEKEQKKAMSRRIEERTACRQAGLIGHTAVFYRRNRDIEKTKIELPNKS